MKKALTLVIALAMIAALSLSTVALAEPDVDDFADPESGNEMIVGEYQGVYDPNKKLWVPVSRGDTMTYAGNMTLVEGVWYDVTGLVSAKDPEFDPLTDLFNMQLKLSKGGLKGHGAKMISSPFGVTTLETENAALHFNNITNKAMFEGDPEELAALDPYIVANVWYAPEYVEPVVIKEIIDDPNPEQVY